MAQQELERKKDRVGTQLLIISKVGNGFRVYSPESPGQSYIVGCGHKGPTCTCPDFQTRNGDPKQRCSHIIAVREQVGELEDIFPQTQAEHQTGEQVQQADSTVAHQGTQMHIKRSVSPDGRIDSFSVSFSCGVDMKTVNELVIHATKMLQIQSVIVGSFLQKKTKENGQTTTKPQETNGVVPAKMLTIGGMPGKWGQMLFINVKVDGIGKVLKLFGSVKQLEGHLRDSNFPHLAPTSIREGTRLNHPCRVTTKPSSDGKYLNIIKVFPLEQQNGQGRNGS